MLLIIPRFLTQSARLQVVMKSSGFMRTSIKKSHRNLISLYIYICLGSVWSDEDFSTGGIVEAIFE
jgi:predicted pyridoxine 5'-phosphate oxidase superfamily flavin-nucleotide-binding protein